MNFRRPKNFVVVFNLYRAEAIVLFLSLMHKLHEATEGVKPNKQILLSHLEELTVLCILVKHLAMICSSQSQSQSMSSHSLSVQTPDIYVPVLDSGQFHWKKSFSSFQTCVVACVAVLLSGAQILIRCWNRSNEACAWKLTAAKTTSQFNSLFNWHKINL